MDNLAHRQQGSPVLMSDPAVRELDVHESGEPLANLLDYPQLLIDQRLADTKGHFRLVRKGVAERLVKASTLLPEGVRLLVIEGYRPISLQTQYFNDYLHELEARYPQAPEEEIHRLASRYVAPPRDLPPHCCGAAIDLTLCDQGGQEFDMGTAINATPEHSGDQCFTNAADISVLAKRNRKTLTNALLGAGLVNYPTEWWHWSYGDRYWAMLTKSPHTIYGLIDPEQPRSPTCT